MKLYELATPDGVLYSSPCWRIRLLLELRGLDFESVPINYKKIPTVRGPHDEEFKTVPILCNEMLGMNDSWEIANYLDRSYAARGKLFRNEAERAQSVYMQHMMHSFYMLSFRLAAFNIFNALADEDKEYFRTTREKRLGCRLEDAAKGADPGKLIKAFDTMSNFLETEKFFGGDIPNYADIIVLSHIQYCVQTGRVNIPAELPPIGRWVGRCAQGLPSLKKWYDGGGAVAAAASVPAVASAASTEAK